MTRKVSNYHLGVNGRCQINATLLLFLIEGVPIWHNDCLWCVDYNIERFLITALTFESKFNVKYTYNQFMACYANSYFIFRPMVFILSTIIADGV